MTDETREWEERPHVEDPQDEPEIELQAAEPALVPSSEAPPLAELQRPLQTDQNRTRFQRWLAWLQPRKTRRGAASVERLAAAFKALQDGHWSLAVEAGPDAAVLRNHILLLAQDQTQIETLLREGRSDEAWGVCNAAWLRFARIVPLDRLDLLLGHKLYSSHPGTGTQTLVGYFEALREGAALLAHNPGVDPAQLREYVLILEQARPRIEQALAAKQFDQAWFLLRGLWELRLGILPAEQLEAERQALELLIRSVGSTTRRKKLQDALETAKTEADVSHLRSVLVWVKREVNESAQVRYWKFNIYQRRVQMTAQVLVAFLLVLTAATVVLQTSQGEDWYRQLALLLGVLFAGSLGGAVSGLRTSEEISQQRLSSAYFKQAVTSLRMLVGAAAALAVYFVLASGLLAVRFGSEVVQDLVYLVFGFLSGFSERFFLQALDQAGGNVGLPLGDKPQPKPADKTAPKERQS